MRGINKERIAVASKLKEVRLRDFLIDNQKTFAEKIINMSRQQYSRYETGEMIPQMDTAFIIRDRINAALKEKGINKSYTLDELFYPVYPEK
ncbi:MAG: hypothetical protein PWP27_610 [Clostridiales bacterium]|jgi:DNA-binding XRE family transcriptional regulator|nr:hypothetical protein [Clostridiales bacterium]